MTTIRYNKYDIDCQIDIVNRTVAKLGGTYTVERYSANNGHGIRKDGRTTLLHVTTTRECYRYIKGMADALDWLGIERWQTN